jgi:hypothetical protein
MAHGLEEMSHDDVVDPVEEFQAYHYVPCNRRRLEAPRRPIDVHMRCSTEQGARTALTGATGSAHFSFAGEDPAQLVRSTVPPPRLRRAGYGSRR